MADGVRGVIEQDENNTLRVQNNELSSKLRRAEHLNSRVSEELAKYRTAQGKPAAINLEEEERLRTLLQEVKEERDTEAQKLAKLCSSVIKAAGLVDGDSPAVALEAVEHLKDHLDTTRQEFEDFKLKVLCTLLVPVPVRAYKSVIIQSMLQVPVLMSVV